MTEQCPLSGGGRAIESLPRVCMMQCAKRWESALTAQGADTDDYEASSEGCNHEMHPVEFSHEALQAVDETSKRYFSIVDMCANCRTELQENSYTFDCPHNGHD